MYSYIKDKLSRIIVTLRVSLLSIFISLFVITMITLFSVFYFHLSDLVKRAAFLLVEKDAYSVVSDLNTHLYPTEGASRFTVELIQANVFNVKNNEIALGYMTYLLKKLRLVNGVYWGDISGNFVYSREEDDGTTTSEIINRSVTPATETYIYYDKDGNETKRIELQPDFDPRGRPWFEKAKQKKDTIWTNVYLYAQGAPHLGITIATPAYSKGQLIGVFGMDLRLDYLSRYVASQKIGKTGEVFVIDAQGRLLASPQLISTDRTKYYKDGVVELGEVSKVYKAAFDEFKRHKNNMFDFEVGDSDYIGAFVPIPSLTEQGWYLGVIDHEAEFTRPIRELQFIYVMIDLVIFLIGILLISGLTTRIVNPIKKLVKETEKIKNFHLETSDKIVSRIKEVIDLSNGLHSMKLGLRSFQRYVPASLVRQLIKAGEDARVGGTKRELAIFFSDIVDFTSITEEADTNELVLQICAYFDAFTQVITQDKGTIDKYIGDAIMAFWGAPLIVKDPCGHAAHAALSCMEILQTLNANWASEGKPQFMTRFGLHFGEAIVGNIGSSERLNYTALGDSINTTARLINANKLYGTMILASEPVYERAKNQFVFRFVDQIVFKGKAKSTAIYELLAESKSSILFDIDAYRHEFELGFAAYQHQQWEEAKQHFEVCLQIYPQDGVAVTFIERCNNFSKNPPTQWDGVWHLTQK